MQRPRIRDGHAHTDDGTCSETASMIFTDCFQKFFANNLSILGLNPSVREDPNDWKYLQKRVSNELTSQRLWMKNKVCGNSVSCL